MALAVAGAALLLISAELAIRARVALQDPHRWVNDLFLYPPDTQVGDDPALTTNNAGFFGPDLAQPKPPGTYRVFLLGSSPLTNPVLPAAMQQRLQALCPERAMEAHSTGLPRYTSYHNWLLMERRLAQLEPDCVVLYMGMNDNVYNTNPGLRGRPPVGLWNWAALDKSLALSMLWYYGIHKRFEVTPEFEEIRSASIFESHVDRILAAAQAEGADVLLMAMATAYPTEDADLLETIRANESPMKHFWGNLEPSLRGLQAHTDVMQELAAQNGLPFADPNPELDKNSHTFRDLCHLTRKGNQALGHFLAEQVAPLARKAD